MKNKKINIAFIECDIDELSAEDRELVEAAKKATGNSYAKYSHFCVGAAVRLANGSIILGANQENAAFPSGLCAERSALFGAGAQYPDQKVLALAIAAKNADGFTAEPVSPCGACRQVMKGTEERFNNSMRILLYGTRGIYVIDGASNLLPLSFISSSLGKI